MGFFRKIDSFFCKLEEAVLSLSIIAMTILLIGNVIARELLDGSWAFTLEIGRFLLVAVTFVGTGYAARKGRHIRMSALSDLMPYKVKKVLLILVTGLTAITLFFVAIYGIRYVIEIKELGTVSPSLRVPVYLITILVPFGLLLAVVQYARAFILNITQKDVYISGEKKDNS